MSSGGEMGFHAALSDDKAASFFDGAREGVMAFMAVGLLCTIAVSSFAPRDYRLIVVIMGILAVSTASMIVVARFFRRRNARAREVEAEAYRAMMEEIRIRQIAEMNAKSAEGRIK